MISGCTSRAANRFTGGIMGDVTLSIKCTSYIEDILSYEECKDKYDGVKYTLLSFCRREACTAIVYKNQDNMKERLIYADEEFVSGMKAAIAEN